MVIHTEQPTAVFLSDQDDRQALCTMGWLYEAAVQKILNLSADLLFPTPAGAWVAG